jgi:O-antigen/teichoic acid export membrane protein
MSEDQQKNQPPEADFKQSPSLKQKAIRGSIWTLAGNQISQVLRLGGNLILTRLLFPEAFGLMALVQSFLMGLEMFSDVGIGPSIIQNKRGNDPAFLNTAWTLQVFRGVALWICACLIAWPAAQFYHEPMLMQLLPVVGLTSLIGGLNSTKLGTANRQLMLGRLTLIELGSYVLNLLVIIVMAWMYRSVWAIVAGGIVSSLAKMILSHTVLEGEQNRLHWERAAFRELQRFGQWVFFSTALTFVAAQGDRLILGRLLDVRFLGIYGIAIMMSRVLNDAIQQIAGRVLFPSYSELIRDRPERLYPVLRRCRILMIALSWCGSLFFIAFGKQLIDFLYDNRYADAGWMLKTFAIGGLVGILNLSYDNILIAKGKTFANAAFLAIQVTLQVPAIFLGHYWGGQHGVIIALACVDWIMYLPNIFFMAPLSLWQPEVDIPVIAVATGIAAFVLLN